jgi:glycosyltransferase involved in cell wall biosynthesis
MVNVLFLLNHAGRGGSERYIQTLVQQLGRNAINPFFAYNESGPLKTWMEAQEVPCFQIDMNGPFDFKAARALAALCREHKIEVVHTHYLRENYIALLAKLFYSKIRVIYTYHILSENPLPIRISNTLIETLQYKIIANCTAGKARLIANGNHSGKIVLIPNAVDLDYWANGDPEALRRELCLSNSVFIILFTARITEGKGHKFMLDTLKLLKDMTDIDFRLVLAGDGELRCDMEVYSKRLDLDDRVIFLGHRNDMPDIYHSADLTVCPSESETLNYSLLESMACGVPVIATAVGGMTDIVTDAHDCGILVEYGNCTAFASALLKLMNDKQLLKRYAEGALRSAKADYDLISAAESVLRLYNKGGSHERS